jgi:hypothetical protein
VEFAIGASLDSNMLKTRGVAEKNDTLRHVSAGNYEKVKPELVKLLKQAVAIGLEHCTLSEVKQYLFDGSGGCIVEFSSAFFAESRFLFYHCSAVRANIHTCAGFSLLFGRDKRHNALRQEQ